MSFISKKFCLKRAESQNTQKVRNENINLEHGENSNNKKSFSSDSKSTASDSNSLFDVDKLKVFAQDSLKKNNINVNINSISESDIKANISDFGAAVRNNLLSTFLNKNSNDLESEVENINFLDRENQANENNEETNLSELLGNFKSFAEFDFYLENNKQKLANENEILLLYFDYLAEFNLKIKNLKLNNFSKDTETEGFTINAETNLTRVSSELDRINCFSIIEKIINLIEEKLLSLDPFLIISFIESLHKSRYYSSNKIWIKLEYILLRTNMLRNISMDYYFIISNAFEYYFNREDSTILADEIFELIEYNFILSMKETQTEKVFLNKLNEDFKIFENNFIHSFEKFYKINSIIPLFQTNSNTHSGTNNTNSSSNHLFYSDKLDFKGSQVFDDVLHNNFYIIYNKHSSFTNVDADFSIIKEFKEFENSQLKKFWNLCKLFYSFAKNLEGSCDFYKVFIDKIFSLENLQIFNNILISLIIYDYSANEQISQGIGSGNITNKLYSNKNICEFRIVNEKLFETVVSLYFSSVLIQENTCNKAFISYLISNLELFILNLFKNFDKHLKKLMNQKTITIGHNNSSHHNENSNIEPISLVYSDLYLHHGGEKILIHNVKYLEQGKKFIFIPNSLQQESFINEETKEILLWCFAKRNLINDNHYLLYLLSS